MCRGRAWGAEPPPKPEVARSMGPSDQVAGVVRMSIAADAAAAAAAVPAAASAAWEQGWSEAGVGN